MSTDGAYPYHVKGYATCPSCGQRTEIRNLVAFCDPIVCAACAYAWDVSAMNEVDRYALTSADIAVELEVNVEVTPNRVKASIWCPECDHPVAVSDLVRDGYVLRCPACEFWWDGIKMAHLGSSVRDLAKAATPLGIEVVITPDSFR